MSLQYSVALRNAQLDEVETIGGTTPNLLFFSGTVAANCAAADPAGTLATIALPSDWMAAASAGAKALAGSWAGTASGSGTIASWRLKTSGGTCFAQGTVTATGGGGDLTLDNVVVASGQAISITTFTLTAGNA